MRHPCPPRSHATRYARPEPQARRGPAVTRLSCSVASLARMRKGMRETVYPPRFGIRTLALLLCLAAAGARAGEAAAVAAPAALRVDSALAPEPGTTDLKFREFYTLPIGPKGLTPSARLLGLAGQRVRMVGYMARQDAPSAGMLILAPLPVALGDEDESFSDDLPATALYVHLAAADREQPVPWMPGPLAVTGVLELGAAREADGRLSFVRLQLDPALSRSVVTAH